MSSIIGVLQGREETFPPALVAELNARGTEYRARQIRLGGVEVSDEPSFRVLVDRISHKVPFFRAFLKQQALLGAYCLHNPFWMESVDRLVVAQLARRAGVPCLTTILLPPRDHPPGVVSEDLENLAFPLPWEHILETVELPATLRPAALGGRELQQIEHLAQLWDCFATTGFELQVLQNRPTRDQRRIVLVAGEASRALSLVDGIYRWDEPVDSGWAVEASRLAVNLCQTANLDLAGVEFAVEPQGPVLVDLHLYPELDWWSLSEEAFAWAVGATADVVLERAKQPPQTAHLGVPVKKIVAARKAAPKKEIESARPSQAKSGR
jgi:hypothetical protein